MTERFRFACLGAASASPQRLSVVFCRKTGVYFALLFFLSTLHAETSRVDPTFDPGAGSGSGFVEATMVQPDGKVLVCGNFTSFGGEAARHYVTRLNSDGSLDPSFQSDVGYWVRNLAVQPDGKVVIGGFFTDVAGTPRNRVARLNADGSLDTSFDPGTGCAGKIVPVDPTDPFIFAVGIQSDGKILIGGNFTNYNGAVRYGIVRLNSDGSLDGSFDIGAGVNSWIRSLRVMPNGQILVTGWFTSYNNQPHNRMVLLNPDGSADTSFNPIFGDSTAIYTTAPQPDGKIVVGGHSINPDAPFTKEIVRLNPDGSYDSSFNPSGSGANDKVEIVLLQSDGKIIIGGYFNRYNDVLRLNLARLNSDGSLDDTYVVPTDNWVFSGTLQPDQRALICGAFHTVDNLPREGVARLFTSDTPVPPPPTNTPVKPLPGTYNGVFFETDQPQERSSGYLTMKVVASGAFSGKCTLDGMVNTFSGKFDTNGVSNFRVVRRGKTPLTNSVVMVPSAQQVLGIMSDGNWSAPLQADRWVFNSTNRATAYSGRYTLAMPGGTDSTVSPAGSGYGQVTVDSLGNIRLLGSLADGTSISQQTTFSKDGNWPFYLALYSGKGCVVGWLNLTNNTSALVGSLTWIKPANSRSSNYKGGFTNQAVVIGGRYAVPARGRVLDFTNGVVTLNVATFTTPVVNSVKAAANGAITVDRSATNHLHLTIDKKTGIVSGSFINPTTRRSNTIRGVVLQNEDQATGYFLTPGQSGDMELTGN